MWPFSKKSEAGNAPSAETPDTSASPAAAGAEIPAPSQPGVQIVTIPHDPVNGANGPYDGDHVDIESFDFKDFSVGILDLGSMRIPLPKDSQVQVEMGPEGPKMLHIVTRVGRITPVAFAAPRSSGQWAEAAQDLLRGIEKDGLTTSVEEGPWGSEVLGHSDNGVIRIVGIEGPRWMLRLTLAAPAGMEDELAVLGREVAARTFVYRGDDPVLAGNSLPVVMPAPLVEEMQKAMKQREEAQKAEANKQPTDAEAQAAAQLRELKEDN
ncbi:DUF3710 domain-containing protein [Corynebacterium phoceense]|uniref:DUF3710 domain-containing protein n=1 Tax=Corynebacterium phoceense TaxID=1686286 RepID=UPI00211BFB84|nr:DUF3710 domain-containing protein [Corynebacterium phoceense]MCQ9335695.1 DUF3710 domain-containing protein [Corynebacterium phoceense]